jgi:hypothetical protein
MIMDNRISQYDLNQSGPEEKRGILAILEAK